ncbi:MAG: helix-turn-helix transcriptional regulator, partial [Firmicutes bacterium]|nr:helix-turn-helix transcriptional regulator [Bacillota bacterium]
MDYTKRLRDLRTDHDKTQAEIAAILETSQTMYARYERG